jgi:hypothetical protein
MRDHFSHGQTEQTMSTDLSQISATISLAIGTITGSHTE